MGSSSHHSFLSSKSSRHGSNKSRSSYNSCSFSVNANSDIEESSASDDIKTAMSSEAPDLSTVTSLTDPVSEHYVSRSRICALEHQLTYISNWLLMF